MYNRLTIKKLLDKNKCNKMLKDPNGKQNKISYRHTSIYYYEEKKSQTTKIIGDKIRERGILEDEKKKAKPKIQTFN